MFACYLISIFLSFFYFKFSFRKSDINAEPEESPGSSSSSRSSSSITEAADALSKVSTPQPSSGEPGQTEDSNCSDSLLESSSSEEEDVEGEEHQAMFSSKFLSGANPLNAVTSAVNKFGLFGDDEQGDKNRKTPPQQRGKPLEKEKPRADPGKGPQLQHVSQKSGQEKSESLPNHRSAQGCVGGQTDIPIKAGGQQATQKAGGKIAILPKEEQPKKSVKVQDQEGSPKLIQQHAMSKSGIEKEFPKVSPKTGTRQQGPVKTATQQQQPKVQEYTTAGPQKPGTMKGSPEVSQQKQSSSDGPKQRGSPKVLEKKQASQTVEKQQQQSQRSTSQQLPTEKTGQEQQGLKGTNASESLQTGTGSKDDSQSKQVSRVLCQVCTKTELNFHTTERPNYNTCTQCKTEVCNLCGFSPPDSEVSPG